MQETVIVFGRMSFYQTRWLDNNINISNMMAVNLLQLKKWSWGKLSQISRGKLSAPIYCEFPDDDYE